MSRKWLEVFATDLGGELIRVEFRNSNIISDHPVASGGTGKGASPAGLLLSALAGSALFTVRDVVGKAVPLPGITARTAMRIDREHIAGPFPGLIYLGQLWRRVELPIGLAPEIEEAARASLARCPIARALEQGIAIDERVEFRPTQAAREAREKHSDDALGARRSVEDLAEGERRSTPVEPRWRLSATEVGHQAGLINLRGQLQPVARTAELLMGPSPAEMLLGALAACTAIYVSRYTTFGDIPMRSVNVCVRAEIDEDEREPITRIEKMAEIVGPLTESEYGDCKFFADVCAIGETMKRGVPVEDLLLQDPALSPDPVSNLGREAAMPAAAMDCEDGSCCVPQRAPPVPAAG